MKHRVRCLTCLVFSLFFLPSFGRAETLERLVSSALDSHPSIRSHLAQERAAKAGADSARWQFFPTPSIAIERAETSSTNSSYQGDSTVSILRLQQPLWTGGRLTAGLEKAESGVMAGQASTEYARQQIALRVVQAYGDWLAAHLKIQAFQKSLDSHIRLRELVKRRIEQGVSAESDLILTIGRLESTAADLSAAQTQRDTALARLEQLAGRRLDTETMGDGIAGPRQVNAEAQTLTDLALALNPALQKAQAQAKVQEAIISERRADLLPEVQLRAERQHGNYSYENAPDESRLFIGLSSRFGAGLSSLANIEGAEAQHRAAMEEIEAQSRLIIEQVLADHALAVSAGSRLAAIKASLEALGQISESYDRQFLAGRRTWLDVMNTARELAQTEAQLADTRAAQVVVSWRLAIYTQDLADIIKR